ncbi:hypothetical protein B0T25DRAFT_181791 [Lasiosphaeria hispida]|uniref:Transmembrane protein n=1 Tax=Lasiosphaeria hispida TaxID=260671 RepID=A0AAJ0HH44_9PEZI|nr:hypothetical protein B0T25DRAFT_181791 [Lasiosphaeria hispida]
MDRTHGLAWLIFFFSLLVGQSVGHEINMGTKRNVGVTLAGKEGQIRRVGCLSFLASGVTIKYGCGGTFWVCLLNVGPLHMRLAGGVTRGCLVGWVAIACLIACVFA